MTCYNKEPGNANAPHGGSTAGKSMLYQAVPDSRRSWQNKRPTRLTLLSYLMVSAPKLRKRLKGLFTFHFSDSKLIDETSHGQTQQNLDERGYIMNWGDWNLAKRVINQSKIR
jgi:hypothetical protein